MEGPGLKDGGRTFSFVFEIVFVRIDEFAGLSMSQGLGLY